MLIKSTRVALVPWLNRRSIDAGCGVRVLVCFGESRKKGLVVSGHTHVTKGGCLEYISVCNGERSGFVVAYAAEHRKVKLCSGIRANKECCAAIN
jgi:hypothetical protein